MWASNVWAVADAGEQQQLRNQRSSSQTLAFSS